MSKGEEKLIAAILIEASKCGGPGSGRPGPCPRGGGAKPSSGSSGGSSSGGGGGKKPPKAVSADDMKGVMPGSMKFSKHGKSSVGLMEIKTKNMRKIMQAQTAASVIGSKLKKQGFKEHHPKNDTPHHKRKTHFTHEDGHSFTFKVSYPVRRTSEVLAGKPVGKANGYFMSYEHKGG